MEDCIYNSLTMLTYYLLIYTHIQNHQKDGLQQFNRRPNFINVNIGMASQVRRMYRMIVMKIFIRHTGQTREASKT